MGGRDDREVEGLGVLELVGVNGDRFWVFLLRMGLFWGSAYRWIEERLCLCAKTAPESNTVYKSRR